MQEQKNVTTSSDATDIHLHCATARCDADVIGKRTGAGGRAIPASSIHDNQLNATFSIGSEGLHCRFYGGGLVQHRHDDR
jgi:hypothetical protein